MVHNLITKLLEMPALTYQPGPAGLSFYQNQRFVLAGGGRSGSSPPGLTRLRYDIYDQEAVKQGSTERLGYVELFVNSDGEIEGLVDISLDKPHQGSGYGRKIIKDITDTTKAGLTVHDIKKKAQGFWQKMGLTYTKGKRQGFLSK